MRTQLERLGHARRCAAFWKLVRAAILCDEEERAEPSEWTAHLGDLPKRIVPKDELRNTNDPPCWRHRGFDPESPFDSGSWETRDAWCAGCVRRQRAHEAYKKWAARAARRLSAATRSAPLRRFDPLQVGKLKRPPKPRTHPPIPTWSPESEGSPA